MPNSSSDSLASRLGALALQAAESPEERRRLEFLWRFWARPAQVAPAGDWTTWLILAGRGFGKTRAGAEWVREQAERGEARRIALVARTASDIRDTLVEGESGILAVSPPWFRPRYEPSKRRLTWPNGVVATTYSADEPDLLRGPQHHAAWCDELAAWRYPEAWDQLQFGLRLGQHPRAVVTTTPRPTKIIRQLAADRTTRVTKGTTYDNRANLAPTFFDKVVRKYEGTRLGRQELNAELLGDTPGALWTLKLLDGNRAAVAPDLVRIVVAVDPQAADPKADPSEQGAETGIVAAGRCRKGEGYVLRDASGQYSPAEWGECAVLLLDELRGDSIVAEVNQGGAMVEHVVRSAAEKLHREGKRPSPHVPYRAVHASRGKLTRAEPVAALDEQHRIHHVGDLAALEDQMCTWVPGHKSPDRMDARVWALTELLVEPEPRRTATEEHYHL
jgi:phage terminase large subunit-like protein